MCELTKMEVTTNILYTGDHDNVAHIQRLEIIFFSPFYIIINKDTGHPPPLRLSGNFEGIKLGEGRGIAPSVNLFEFLLLPLFITYPKSQYIAVLV